MNLNLQIKDAVQNIEDFINQPYDFQTYNGMKTFIQSYKFLCKNKVSLNFQSKGQWLCNYCNQIIRNNIDQINLYCNHSLHIQCLKDYAEKVSPKLHEDELSMQMMCQKCKTMIDLNLIKQYMGNEIQKRNEEEAKSLEKEFQLKDQKDREEYKQNLTFECNYCMNDVNIIQRITLSCGQFGPTDHYFCQPCLTTYITDQINNGKVTDDQLKCPSQNCQTPIDQYIIKDIASKELFQKYLDFQGNEIEVKVGANEKFWRCPTPNCKNIILFNTNSNEIFIYCENCQKEFCAYGCSQVHREESCDQFKKRVNEENDQQAMNFIQNSNIRQCQSCKYYVEKTVGCNHMTCRCTYEFCYVCGVKWQQCNHGYYGS